MCEAYAYAARVKDEENAAVAQTKAAAEAALRRGDERGLPDGVPGPSGAEAYEQVARGAVEAILNPGDALFFPADWAHHIESRGDLSVALSLREVGGVLVGGFFVGLEDDAAVV